MKRRQRDGAFVSIFFQKRLRQKLRPSVCVFLLSSHGYEILILIPLATILDILRINSSISFGVTIKL